MCKISSLLVVIVATSVVHLLPFSVYHSISSSTLRID